MADEAKVLLFEGIHGSRGGHSVFGRKTCRRYKRVRSSSGKMIRRCADFSGGDLGSLGALPFDLEALKGTLLTGAVAVGGAVLAAKAVGYIAPMLKIDPLDKEGKPNKWLMVIEVVIGLLAGYAVGKYARKPDLGAAVALGPVVVNGLKVVGLFLQPGASSAIAGHYGSPSVRASEPLGMTVPGGYFPEWAFQSGYQDTINKQNPAWAMG
ncbi:hypothetical protein LCGC14_0565690 [marine sediment metagenome]|uniref:Uncharacterized protein n=1 Tax=marine sediment metagenome TaxID=412755 RepID=A0A0F9S4A5_9ZZZZ